MLKALECLHNAGIMHQGELRPALLFPKFISLVCMAWLIFFADLNSGKPMCDITPLDNLNTKTKYMYRLRRQPCHLICGGKSSSQCRSHESVLLVFESYVLLEYPKSKTWNAGRRWAHQGSRFTSAFQRLHVRVADTGDILINPEK